MTFFYLDTSALVKNHVKERGTEVVRQLMASEATLVTSFWTVLECHSALSLIVRRGEMRKRDYRAVLQTLDSDIQERLLLLDVDNFLVKEATLVADRSSLGAADSFHLACAIQLRTELPTQSSVELVFVTADKPLCHQATLENFAILNPEDSDAAERLARWIPPRTEE